MYLCLRGYLLTTKLCVMHNVFVQRLVFLESRDDLDATLLVDLTNWHVVSDVGKVQIYWGQAA